MPEVDWPTVVSGAAVFITTCVVTYKGWQDRKKEDKEEPGPARIISGVIQDNSSIHANTVAIQELSRKIDRLCDIMLMTGALRQLDHD